MNKWLIIAILIFLGIIYYFLAIYPVHATYEGIDWEICEGQCPSPSPSISPSPEPSESPEPSLEPSPSPSQEPGRPGLTDPGPGGSSGSDGHCTYDPNRSACGGKDPVMPKAPPATGRGGE